MKSKGEFTVGKWDEKKSGEISNNMVMTCASIIYNATGNIQGEFNVEYILHYTNYSTEDQHNSEATYLGYMVFVGSIDGKSGTFVLEDNGVFSAAGPASEFSIKPNTGTGDLAGISGKGRFFADESKMIIEIDYNI